jgi:hypothetical protein
MPDGSAYAFPMLGGDGDLLSAEGFGNRVHAMTVNHHLENPADIYGGFYVNYPFSFVFFTGNEAVGDTARTALPFFHTQLENVLYLPSGIGNVKFVYGVTDGALCFCFTPIDTLN